MVGGELTFGTVVSVPNLPLITVFSYWEATQNNSLKEIECVLKPIPMKMSMKYRSSTELKTFAGLFL